MTDAIVPFGPHQTGTRSAKAGSVVIRAVLAGQGSRCDELTGNGGPPCRGGSAAVATTGQGFLAVSDRLRREDRGRNADNGEAVRAIRYPERASPVALLPAGVATSRPGAEHKFETHRQETSWPS